MSGSGDSAPRAWHVAGGLAVRHRDCNIDIDGDHTAARLGLLHMFETPASTAGRCCSSPEGDVNGSVWHDVAI